MITQIFQSLYVVILRINKVPSCNACYIAMHYVALSSFMLYYVVLCMFIPLCCCAILFVPFSDTLRCIALV